MENLLLTVNMISASIGFMAILIFGDHFSERPNVHRGILLVVSITVFFGYLWYDISFYYPVGMCFYSLILKLRN
ncbi:hypothetical protein ASwh1_206 [Aeromonas phage Aswh_1]|nr:hypothetical protein ASwh1_206 [Aeromonas phage Aswh_1]